MKTAAILLLAFLGAAAATELTPDNWDEHTAGKTVFIKFLAPWCGHCKRMKPAWDKLMKEYDGHASAGVFDVDCTAAGKPLCDSNGVRGFPTIKHGDPNNLEDYEGGRDFDALQKFASENLKPSCGPANLELCDDDKKSQIEGFLAMSDSDLDAKISEKDKEIEEAESTFKSEVEKLQASYEKLMATKDSTIEDVKNSGLGLMKACKAHKAGAAKEEL